MGAVLASARKKNFLRVKGLPFWVVAPLAAKGAALKKERSAYAAAVMQAKPLDVE